MRYLRFLLGALFLSIAAHAAPDVLCEAGTARVLFVGDSTKRDDLAANPNVVVNPPSLGSLGPVNPGVWRCVGSSPNWTDVRLATGPERTALAAEQAAAVAAATAAELAARRADIEAAVSGDPIVTSELDSLAKLNALTSANLAGGPHPVVPTTVKLTGNQTFANSTLANVTGLSFPVTAGVYYRATFGVVFSSDTATVGIKLGLTTPAFTVLAASVRIPVGADGVTGEGQGFITTSGDNVIGTAVPAINTNYLAMIDVLLLPSASGTLQVQASNETGVTVVSVKQGSHGILQVIQ